MNTMSIQFSKLENVPLLLGGEVKVDHEEEDDSSESSDDEDEELKSSGSKKPEKAKWTPEEV